MPARPLTHPEYLARAYAPELDGLRAVAVLLVIAVHVSWEAFSILSGYLGVTVFFVLSGYLITTLALREEAARGRLHLGAFYVRRTFRIFPLYYLTLAGYAAVLLGTAKRPEQTEFLTDHWPHYVFYLQEVAYEEAQAAGRSMPLTQSWSLGIEEKFYLVWPALAFVALAGMSRWRVPVAVLLFVAFAATPCYLEPAGYRQLTHCLIPYAYILAGCLLALVLHHPAGYAAFLRVRGPAGGLLLVGLWAAAHLMTRTARREDFGPLWPTIYALTVTLMLGAAVTGDGPFQRALRWRPLTETGRLSYAMYLTHLLPLYAAHALAGRLSRFTQLPGDWWGWPYVVFAFAVAGSILLAAVLAVTIERPCIRLGRRLSDRLMHSGRPAPAGTPAAPARVELVDSLVPPPAPTLSPASDRLRSA